MEKLLNQCTNSPTQRWPCIGINPQGVSNVAIVLMWFHQHEDYLRRVMHSNEVILSPYQYNPRTALNSNLHWTDILPSDNKSRSSHCWFKSTILGTIPIIKTLSYQNRGFLYTYRHSHDYLIFIMEIPMIPGKKVFILKRNPSPWDDESTNFFWLRDGYIHQIIGSSLTHWGWVMDIWVSKQTIIGSDNSLSPGRRQAIIWTNAILLIQTLVTNFSEILSEIHTSSFKKMHLKLSSA